MFLDVFPIYAQKDRRLGDHNQSIVFDFIGGIKFVYDHNLLKSQAAIYTQLTG